MLNHPLVTTQRIAPPQAPPKFCGSNAYNFTRRLYLPTYGSNIRKETSCSKLSKFCGGGVESCRFFVEGYPTTKTDKIQYYINLCAIPYVIMPDSQNRV